jgi:hypothetical protein
MQESIHVPESPFSWVTRLFVLLSIVGIAAGGIYWFEFTRSTIRQSRDWVQVDPNATAPTFSSKWPSSATRYQYARASVGFERRLTAFVVDGSIQDLRKFAEQEFLLHWDKPSFVVDESQPSPFPNQAIDELVAIYGVRLDWLRASTSATGSIYRTKEKLRQVPLFFIDEEAGLLYGVVTE